MDNIVYIVERGTQGITPKCVDIAIERVKLLDPEGIRRLILLDAFEFEATRREFPGCDIVKIPGDLMLRGEPVLGDLILDPAIADAWHYDIESGEYRLIEYTEFSDEVSLEDVESSQAVRVGPRPAKMRRIDNLWTGKQVIGDDVRFSENLLSGERVDPVNDELSVGAMVAVVTKEVSRDLWSLMGSVCWYMPEAPLHLVVDDETAEQAELIGDSIGYDNFHVHRWITAESLREAEMKSETSTSHSGYWKAGPIWWKLEGLRRVLAKYENKRGVLLVDSDITFCGPVTEVFRGVDCVLSPFYWPRPEIKIHSKEIGKAVEIVLRDGWYNAGYLLAGCESVAKTWLELYEAGEGGFYEQRCIHSLAHLYRYDCFGVRHNWGMWRNEIPPDHVVSLHCHVGANYRTVATKALEDRMNREIELLKARFDDLER